MALSLDDVRRVAFLARIEVSDADAAAVLEKLTGVFGMIEDLQKIDTSGVEPMSHAQDIPLRLREDAVTETDQHALFQSIAPRLDGEPQVEDSLYLVPKVIE
jgi:aspartyl-tRNA(Asn)/glutamyl-tRNA(Gln) amidotransferase subunit C